MTAFVDLYAERPWKGIPWLVLDEAGVVVEPAQVRLPYREPDGQVRFWRVRTAEREWFWPRPSTCGGLLPFGLETLAACRCPEQAVVFLAEGESDCLALRDKFAAWDWYPSGVYALAVPGATTWQRAWRSYLFDFPCIYVVPDADEAGSRMADRVRADLPWARYVGLPEGEDARSLVQAGGGEALLPFLADAERCWRINAAMRVASDLDDFIRLVAG